MPLFLYLKSVPFAQFDTCKDTLLEVVNELIDIKHIADSFKLLEFYTSNDD